MVVATGGLVMAWMWLKRFGSNLVVAKWGLVVAKGGLESELAVTKRGAW